MMYSTVSFCVRLEFSSASTTGTCAYKCSNTTACASTYTVSHAEPHAWAHDWHKSSTSSKIPIGRSTNAHANEYAPAHEHATAHAEAHTHALKHAHALASAVPP
eukprot:5644372-Pleurochrysis_carterae.AAC.1